MPHYQVSVELTVQINYHIEADSIEDAETEAVDRAMDGEGLDNAWSVDASVFDSVDESAEYE